MSASANQIGIDRRAIAKREHELTHENDEPDCSWCEYDWLDEARRIVEGTSLKMATARHLEACFDRIDELEGWCAIYKSREEG